jgi:hypothetical protein
MVALVKARIIELMAIGVFIHCRITASKPWDLGQYPCDADNVRTCPWPCPQGARNAPQVGLVKQLDSRVGDHYEGQKIEEDSNEPRCMWLLDLHERRLATV